MLDIDEHILYALSPHYYPKPKEVDPSTLRPKSKYQIIHDNDSFALAKRKNKLEKNKKISANLFDKFHYDNRSNMIKPFSVEKTKSKKINYSTNVNDLNRFHSNKNVYMNELINANISMIENNPNIKEKLRDDNFSLENKINVSLENKKLIDKSFEDAIERDINNLAKIDNKDPEKNKFIRNSEKSKENKNKFFLTNIKQSPNRDKFSLMNQGNRNIRSLHLNKAGNRIITENNINIKTEISANHNINENSKKKYLTNFSNYNSTVNKLGQNTRSTMNCNEFNNNSNNINQNPNNFISTFKSKQGSLFNGRITTNSKPIMLTTLSMKKDINIDNLSEAKITKKLSTFNSPNKIRKESNRNTMMSLNKNNSPNLMKRSDSNFKSTFGKKKSLEIDDLSIIKLSPENELRINLLNKKSSINKDYLKLRKMKSLENKPPERKDIIFNKIYSFNSEFLKLLKNEQNKKYDNLYDYQNNIVHLIADKTSMDNLRKLSQKLKTIREINDSFNPVNKVNWKLFGKIMKGVKQEMKSLKDRSFGGESEAIKDSEQFKKELGIQKMKQINLNKKFSKYETSLKRISPYIPEYLVEKFNKSLKIIN